MTRFSPSRISLSALALGLAGTLVYQLATPVPEYEPARTKARRSAPTVSLPEPFVPPALTEFAEIEQRPLFFSARKAFKEEAAVAAQEAPPQPRTPPSLTLIGIILDGNRRIAVAKAGAKSITLIPGSTIEDWSVVAIESDRIALKADDQTQEIRLPKVIASTPAQPRPGSPPQPPLPPQRMALPPGYAPAQTPPRP